MSPHINIPLSWVICCIAPGKNSVTMMVWYCVWNASTKSIIWELLFIIIFSVFLSIFSISQWWCGTGYGTLLWRRLSGKPQYDDHVDLGTEMNAFKKLITCKKKSPQPPGVCFIVNDVDTKCQHEIRQLNPFLHVDFANVMMILILMMLMMNMRIMVMTMTTMMLLMMTMMYLRTGEALCEDVHLPLGSLSVRS